MAFAIMRVAKKKSVKDVSKTFEHNTQEHKTPNHDPEKLAKNRHLGGSAADCMARFDELLPEKRRKNAVLAVEAVLTASPEWGGDWEAYLQAADKWAIAQFGGEKNVLSVTHHYSESTPHSHIVFIPLHEGKLNAKHFIGGHRDRLNELQTDFAEKVGRRFGLERGRPKAETRAQHTAHNLHDLAERERGVEKRDREVKNNMAAVNQAAADLSSSEAVTAQVFSVFKREKANQKEQTAAWNKIIKGMDNVATNAVAAVRQEAADRRAEKTLTESLTPTRSSGRK